MFVFERVPLFCRFNFLFLRRFWLIMRVAVPSVCSKSLLLLVMLVVARAAGQWRKCMVHGHVALQPYSIHLLYLVHSHIKQVPCCSIVIDSSIIW